MIKKIKVSDGMQYVTILNEVVQDPTLSAKAKGILVYLLSLPEDWKISQQELIGHFKDGHDSIRSGFGELIESGYVINRGRIRNEHGRFEDMNYEVYCLPVDHEAFNAFYPAKENPTQVKSTKEKTKLQIKQYTNKTNTNKTFNKESKKEKFELFESIWIAYGRIGSKHRARVLLSKLSLSDCKLIAVHIPKFIDNHGQADKLDFVPHLTSYLNGKRWLDGKLPYKIAVEQESELDAIIRKEREGYYND